MKKLTILSTLAGTALLLCAFPVSPQLSPQGKLSVSLDRASAAIGRPLTPGSIAGVNRRVERRAARRAYYGNWGSPGYGYGVAATGAAVEAAAPSTAYYNRNWGYGPGYGVVAPGRAARAAATSTAYDAFARGGAYRTWDSAAVGYYPTRAEYTRGNVPGSYYGPMCNPRVDRGCQ